MTEHLSLQIMRRMDNIARDMETEAAEAARLAAEHQKEADKYYEIAARRRQDAVHDRINGSKIRKILADAKQRGALAGNIIAAAWGENQPVLSLEF